MRPAGALLCSLLLAVSARDAAAQAPPSFAGKTIRIVINQATGGPTDSFLRHFTRFWESHIPGRPTIIVDNHVGAAGMVGANYLYEVAKPDGLAIGFFASVINDGLVGGAGVKFDITKFRPLGGIGSTQVTLVRTDLKVASPRDLPQAQKPLVIAGYGGWVDIAERLFLQMTGVPFKYITGYTGQAATVMAVRNGEASVAPVGAALYLPSAEAWRKEGIFLALVQRGEMGEDGKFRRSHLIPELPTVAEAVAELKPASLETPLFSAYRKVVGANLAQYFLALPPGTDAATHRVLADATRDTFRDPAAIASAKEKLQLDYSYMDADTTARFIAGLRRDFDNDAPAAEIMRTMIRQ